MNTLLTILATMATTVALVYAWGRFGGQILYRPNWLCRLMGEVPWARIRNFKVLGDNSDEHDLFFVSRHEIAECGLTCPRCKTLVADRGDFSKVERSMVNGEENEVIKCFGMIRTPDDDEGIPCPLWLVASPDTEHGDHLDDAGEVDGFSPCPPSYFRFKRIGAAQALREKYDVDVSASVEQDGTLVATGTAEQVAEAKVRKGNGVFTPEEIAEAYRQNPEAGVPMHVMSGASTNPKDHKP